MARAQEHITENRVRLASLERLEQRGTWASNFVTGLVAVGTVLAAIAGLLTDSDGKPNPAFKPLVSIGLAAAIASLFGAFALWFLQWTQRRKAVREAEAEKTQVQERIFKEAAGGAPTGV